MSSAFATFQSKKSTSGGSGAQGWTNGEAGAITIGQVVYISANRTVKKAVQAGPYAQARVHGIVGSASIGAGALGLIYTGRGTVIPNVPINGALAAGSDVWLDATAGALTTVPLDPTAAGSVGKFLVRVGTISYYAAGVVADLLFDPSVPVGL